MPIQEFEHFLDEFKIILSFKWIYKYIHKNKKVYEKQLEKNKIF